MSQPVIQTSLNPLNAQVSTQQYPSSEINISTCYDFGVLADINAYYVLCDQFGYLINKTILTLNHENILCLLMTRVTANTLKDGYTHMLYVCTSETCYYYAYKYSSNQTLLIHELPLHSPIVQLVNVDQTCIGIGKDHHIYKIGYYQAEGIIYRQFFISNMTQSLIFQFIPATLQLFGASKPDGYLCSIGTYFIANRSSQLELHSLNNCIRSMPISHIQCLQNDSICSIVPGKNSFAIVSKNAQILYFELIGSNYDINSNEYTDFKLVYKTSLKALSPTPKPTTTTIPIEPAAISILSAYGTIDAIYITTTDLKSSCLQRIQIDHQWILHLESLDISITSAQCIINNEPELIYSYASDSTPINDSQLKEYSNYLSLTSTGYAYANSKSNSNLYLPQVVVMTTSLQGIHFYTLPNKVHYILNNIHMQMDFHMPPPVTYAYCLGIAFQLQLYSSLTQPQPTTTELVKQYVLNRINQQDQVIQIIYNEITSLLTTVIKNKVLLPLNCLQLILQELNSLQRICKVYLNHPGFNKQLQCLHFLVLVHPIHFDAITLTWDELTLPTANMQWLYPFYPLLAQYQLQDQLRHNCPSLINQDQYALIKCNEYFSQHQFAKAIQSVHNIPDGFNLKQYITPLMNHKAYPQAIELLLKYKGRNTMLFEVIQQLMQDTTVPLIELMQILYQYDSKTFQFELCDFLMQHATGPNATTLLLQNKNKYVKEWFKQPQSLTNTQIQLLYGKYLKLHFMYEEASQHYLELSQSTLYFIFI